MKSIVIIIDYFGSFPVWFDIFLESCKWNPTINWIIHSDCEYTQELPKNVEIKYISWDDYVNTVRHRLNTSFCPNRPYKICDLKPALGCLWYDEIQQYDFWGFGDMDLVYGDIRSFYTDELLENYDILSISDWGISGPLCLLKNCHWTIDAFCRVPGWKDFFAIFEYAHFDEAMFERVLKDPFGNFCKGIYLKEQFATPLSYGLWDKYPEIVHTYVWHWKNGKITSPANGNREFICLHFMNYDHKRCLDSRYGDCPPWSKLDKIVNISSDEIKNGFVISMDGFTALEGLE